MSNTLAIATVTESLTQLLQEFISETRGGSVPGARVMHLEPNSEELTTGQPIVNVYLYQITRNAALFNQDTPTRGPSGALVRQPRAPINLDYLISFYGDQTTLEPQRLLGSVTAGLHAEPILSPALIARTVAATAWLTGSDLAQSAERVRFTSMEIPPDQLDWFWTSVAPSGYQLSVAYEATGVELDWPGSVVQALPVRQPVIAARPGAAVVIARIVNAASTAEPLVPGATMAITGSNLAAPHVAVLIDGAPVTTRSATPRRIEVDLTAAAVPQLRAGMMAVQVAHQRLAPGAGELVAYAMSPVAHAVLHPALSGTPVYDAGTIRVELTPPVAIGQAAALVLNGLDASLQQSLRIALPSASIATTMLSFPAADVPPDLYLVRVEVGGVQSILQVDQNPTSPTYRQYVGPTVRVPAVPT